MDMNLLAVLGIAVLTCLILLGVNIGMVMMVVGIVGYTIAIRWDPALAMTNTILFTQASNYSFSVIPLFVMMGNFAFAAGLSTGLYDFSNKWMGRLPGGLASASVASCALFGAISGSAVATVATFGVISVPQMRKYGYAPSLATGSVAYGGTLGILIPPSTIFIVYGALTETSAGRLFAAGIMPGVVMTFLSILLITVMVIIKPSLAPKSEKFTWKERFESLKGIIAIAVLFIVCIGGMFAGVFTANEAASVGAFLTLILVFMKKKLTWRSFIDMMRSSTMTSAMVFLNLMGAGVFSAFMTVTQMPANLASWIMEKNFSPFLVLAVMLIIYTIMGMLMDTMPMMTMTVPIFLPIVIALGYDPIWFGVLIVMVSQLGYITPPVGIGCYIIGNMNRDISLATVFKGTLPFCAVIMVTCWLTIFFPSISTWLPKLIYG